jgi:DNA-binding transcriptional ArsR family regulator
LKPLIHPKLADIQLIQVLYALGDPVRMSIVMQLKNKPEMTCNQFKIPSKHKSTLTHHFKVLREAGITSTRIQGREHYLSLRLDELAGRFPGVIESILAVAEKTKPLN